MSHFHFGIYPGGMTGTETGLTTGPADNTAEIQKALQLLQGDASSLLVRCYIGYHSKEKISHSTPVRPEQYVTKGRGLDLVLCFQSEDENMEHWKEFIRTMIHQYQNELVKIQITEEANVNLPSLDGHYKNSRKALVEGVIAAKQEINRLKLNTLVGFNATPDFSPDKLFWKEIASLASDDFRKSIDYVGIDFFPDVFRPIQPDGNAFDLKAAMKGVFTQFRKDIQSIGITSEIPLHITENGWPTGISKTYEQQAIMLEKIIRQIYEYRNEFNITAYELFALRDADSSNPDIFYQFGIMRDDYTPKPAFHVYQNLISELTIGLTK